jgi:hypothetical protein
VLLSTADPNAIGLIAEKHGVAVEAIGETAANRLVIGNRGSKLESWTIAELKDAYEGALERYVG